MSAVDALYYTTVTLSTTGYGDITPITTGARLVNALVVTPMRLLFVIVLVGTTIKSLTRESRHEFRLARWRRRMRNHVIVIGYGTKGRNAVRALLDMGTSKNDIVMIDRNEQAITGATLAGHTAIVGSGTDEDTLREALVERARAVIVAVNRDDTAILATLTVRRMAPRAEIIATAHEAHNAELLEQSGARSVIVSSETAGRLLGLATDNPGTVRVVEDLLSFGHGLDLAQRPVEPNELGQRPTALPVAVLAVIRAGRTMIYSDAQCGELQPGDEIVYAYGASEG